MIDGAGVLTVWLEPGAVAPSAGTVEPNRVIVLDTSASQTEASLRTGRALAERLLDGMSEDQRFALIACDSACESFPSTGLVTAAEVDVARARAWLRARAARGSSDVAGGLEAGLERLAGQPLGQLVYVGDGVASAGPIRGAEIAARVTRALARWPADVRLVGTGRNIDAPSLRAIAEALEATVDLLEPGEPRELAEIAAGLDRPALRDLRVTLPEGMVLAIDPPAAARLGDELELFVLGRGEGEVSVEAAAAAGAVRLSRPISSREGARGYATRSFARAKIERLEASEEHVAEVTALSTQYFVLSRHTSMLVLENDAMFAAFGIERTRGASSGASLALEGSGGTTGTGLGYGAVAANVPPPSGSFSAPFTLGGSGAQVSGGQVGSGAGTGSGLASGSHASSQPKVTMGVASTAGSLPPEVIRRIMRMQTGRFRMCYQRGLQLDPTLSGRIVVRFTIGPSGSVTSAASAGSTVQNAQVVACVVDAFKRMSFPQPEGGGVTVVSPLAFSPDGASSSPLVAFKGTPFGIGLSQGDDGWMKGSPQHLTALEEAVKREPTSRRRRTELVRAQLAAGRFADAVVSARAFADVDPDGALARELLASALIASGDEAQALWEIQALAELSPTSAVVHARVAASLEAANDEPRACAHWISAAELGADPRVQAEALRCRARVLRERDVVLSELAEASAQPLKSLREALERGMAPAYSPPAARHSEVVAKVTCDGAKAACPRVVIVDGRGGVVSDLLPNAAGRSGAPAFNGGSFKALLVGGSDAALARVTLTVGGQTKVSETTRGARATAAVANVPTGMF
ncbi:MAG: AgmX/PglI C-terminal domain-containing protein [Polyangiaceae bacterium]|nr:AgmX/PglI C-terminal domain-containing protein [Polyangiaceae bacterium]